MSIKQALVVDDSKLAQVALKKQLEEHDLVVVLADSGEEALQLLEHRSVDVVFMDHTMPGMDGLQALAAIKRNPRTAMIPVMMYTTKEGEVYVGQARALGGIGVLPKDVQPHVLFDMLLSLGLVKDKRSGEQPQPNSPQRRATDVAEDQRPRGEPPMGISLAALMDRIIEDQAALRAELRFDRDRLARRVAAELVEAQHGARVVQVDPLPDPPPPAQRGWIVPLAAFAAVTTIVALLTWDVARSTATSSPPVVDDAAARAQVGELEVALHAEQAQTQARYLKAIDSLQWAVNRHAGIPFDELPFDDVRAAEVRDLLERLVALDFKGRVRIESHLGEFCLVGDAYGSYELAPPDLPVEGCTLLGHPLDDSTSIADRQSVGFAEFLARSPLANHSGISVELVAHDRAHSMAQGPSTPAATRAGDWNRIAERNNRLEYSLIPSRG
jgi:CheY-like chemotaxis protein